MDIQTLAAPAPNNATPLSKEPAQEPAQAPTANEGSVFPPKPTVEDAVGEKPTDSTARMPSESIKPDLPPAGAIPNHPMADLNGDTKMSEASAPEPPLMAGALQDGGPKPTSSETVTLVLEKEDSLVKDIVKDAAPTAEKPAVLNSVEDRPVEQKPVERPPERPLAAGPVQDPAKEAFKHEMGDNDNGQTDKEKPAKLAPTTSPPEPVGAPSVAEKTAEAAEEATLDAMPALAAEPPATGEKRAANQAETHAGLNVGNADATVTDKADQPPAKKLKVDEEPKLAEPDATNGGVKKSNSKAKKDKKPLPPVGKTARKTRSQGPATEG